MPLDVIANIAAEGKRKRVWSVDPDDKALMADMRQNWKSYISGLGGI